MNGRMKDILHELMETNRPVTGERLANKLEVTSRTIRDDIKRINDEIQGYSAQITSKRGIGYELSIEDEGMFRDFLNKQMKETETHGDVPTTPENRLAYLIKRFLLSEDFIKLDDLADEIYVSRSTLQTDLKQAKQHLEDYSLSLINRPNNGLKLVGSELNRRFAMSQYLFDHKRSPLNLTGLEQLTSIVDLTQKQLENVWTLLLKQLQENRITLSDIAINNLFVHIVIAYKRIKEGYQIDLIEQDIQRINNKKEFAVAQGLIKDIEKELQVTFPKIEVIYITIHLLGTNLANEDPSMNAEIETAMDESIHQLLLQMLEAIEDKFSLGIQEDKELLIGLGLHLKPAINRHKFGMTVRNPLLEDIKANYPLAFEAGIVAAMVLKDKLNISINEGEIAFLALHIEAAIERKKTTSGPKQCYIVCASGMGSAQLIRHRIESEFHSQIEVLGMKEYYKIQEIPFEKVDFIISSVPIKETIPVPVIEVNTILGQRDISKIKQYVALEEKSLKDYFPKSNVFLNQPFKSKEAVINHLAEFAKSVDSLPDNYTQLVYEREEVSPTAYGNMVAIPHPISPQTSRTFLTVCTLDKPIEWGERKVQFVCLLNVEKNSQEDLREMYNVLGQIVNDGRLVQRLIKSRTYHEFIQTILRMEEQQFS